MGGTWTGLRLLWAGSMLMGPCQAITLRPAAEKCIPSKLLDISQPDPVVWLCTKGTHTTRNPGSHRPFPGALSMPNRWVPRRSQLHAVGSLPERYFEEDQPRISRSRHAHPSSWRGSICEISAFLPSTMVHVCISVFRSAQTCSNFRFYGIS